MLFQHILVLFIETKHEPNLGKANQKERPTFGLKNNMLFTGFYTRLRNKCSQNLVHVIELGFKEKFWGCSQLFQDLFELLFLALGTNSSGDKKHFPILEIRGVSFCEF